MEVSEMLQYSKRAEINIIAERLSMRLIIVQVVG